MITSPTGRLYVGSTGMCSIEKRWKSYRNLNCKGQRKLYYSLRKYGAINHKFEIIMRCSLDEILKYETLIGWGFNVLEKENLNLKLPKLGDVYSIISEETREKFRNAFLGNKNPNFGKIRSKEHCRKLSESHKGKKLSLETKNKISNNNPKSNLGKPMSEITKIRLSKSKIGKKQSDTHKLKSKNAAKKSIIQLNLQNNFIKEWDSCIEASRELKITPSSITACCKNKRKTAGSFKWCYKK